MQKREIDLKTNFLWMEDQNQLFLHWKSFMLTLNGAVQLGRYTRSPMPSPWLQSVFIRPIRIQCLTFIRGGLKDISKERTFLRAADSHYVKGTQAWNFFLTFFAETETIWSQGPVTRDFWKSCSIRPRYSTFKHFRVCSASDEIRSAYAQCAMKFVPRMLSINLHVKTVHILPLAEHTRKFIPRMLSVRWNHYLVCSICDKIFPRMLSIRML